MAGPGLVYVWCGAQTYFATTTVAAFQIWLFARGLDGTVKFLNLGGPAADVVVVLPTSSGRSATCD